MPAERSAGASLPTSPSDGAGPSKAPAGKKPPACDRCKAKRVLCHPSAAGCPRCIEKGFNCTTTPVTRKPPRARTRTAVPPFPARSAPLNSSFGPAPTLSSRAATATPEASQHSPSVGEEGLSETPQQLPFELDDVLIADLVSNAGLGFTHPAVRSSRLLDAPPHTVAELESLPTPLATLAYCALTTGSLHSLHPSIIGHCDDNPTTFADAERLGPDLRDFGRRRLPAFLALRAEALRRAKEAGAFLAATAAHAATCRILDFLFAVDRPHDAPRPFLSIFLSHIRVLLPGRSAEEKERDSTQWAMHLCADHLAGLGDGTAVLAEPELPMAVNYTDIDALAYGKDLAEALHAPLRPGQWPQIQTYAVLCNMAFSSLQDKLVGPHARILPLSEAAVLSLLDRVDLLHRISLLLLAHLDRLLADSPANPSLFRHVPFSRIQALKSCRFYAAITWTSLVLPLHRELQHRLASSTSPSPTDQSFIAARFARERLDSYARQARAYGFAALEAVIATIERTPHIVFWTTIQPRLLPQWAEFLVEEYECGNAQSMGDKLVSTSQKLSAALLKIGYSYSTPHLDVLITKLDALVNAETLLAAALALPDSHVQPSAGPPDNPFSFLTLLATDPTLSVAAETGGLAVPPADTPTRADGFAGVQDFPPPPVAFSVEGAAEGTPVGEASLGVLGTETAMDWLWQGL